MMTSGSGRVQIGEYTGSRRVVHLGEYVVHSGRGLMMVMLGRLEVMIGMNGVSLKRMMRMMIEPRLIRGRILNILQRVT